ncbi:TPA: hypothetical protein CPT80_00995 [Candidatus Gastranaerophilales bacterium HUM_9]|nr:MAG TPA: hypothetical protein CPT80_00995 [Candidatus Gastranaerophilales bacterium HUM_9]HBX35407.1 hypothetical protein [Cyanobacteria bacterium UBA11440]
MEVSQNLNNTYSLKDNSPKEKSSKTNIKAAALGTIGGLAGGSIAQNVCALSAAGVVAATSKLGNLPQDTIDIIHAASEKALELGEVKNKGVSIEWLKQSGKKLNLFEKFKIISNPARIQEAIQEGLNAGYARNNKIYMPENKVSFLAFHEIGHSINFNNSKFWKGMQKLRMPALALASLPMIYGAISKESKAEDGKELNKKQKINNFIRNNAGKLSFATMLPVLAEEGMATIRGQKLANQLLPKNIARKVLKGNAVAYTSYLITALGFAAAAYTAVKVKDAFVNKRDAQKVEEQQNQQVQEQLSKNDDSKTKNV